MQSDCLEVVQVKEGFLSNRATKDIPSGSFLTDVWGLVLNNPTAHTLQVKVEKHVVPEGPMKCTNHSCEPNAKFVFEERAHNGSIPALDPGREVFWQMVACRDIRKGEDVTFDYTSTEYDMAESFHCVCGMASCLGEVKGFKYLSPEQQRKRINDVSPVIKMLHNNRL